MIPISRAFVERGVAVVLAVIGVFTFVTSLGYGLIDGSQPQPGLYPAVISAGLVVLAIWWFIVGQGHGGPTGPAAFVEAATHLDDPDDDELLHDALDDEPERMQPAGIRIVVFTIIWSLVPILLLTLIGFVLTMTIYVGGMVVVIARRRWYVVIPITLVVSVLIAVGAHAAGIQLPDPFRLLTVFGV